MSATRQMRRHQERMARKGKLVQPVAKGAERLVSVAFIYEGETHHGFKSHAELRASIGDPSPYKTVRAYQDGFWTSRDRFVTREVAAHVGKLSGQVSPRFSGRDLLSSDVNWSA